MRICAHFCLCPQDLFHESMQKVPIREFLAPARNLFEVEIHSIRTLRLIHTKENTLNMTC